MPTEPRPELHERCAMCGHSFGWHGLSDRRCPDEKVGGEWVAAETFFTPLSTFTSEAK